MLYRNGYENTVEDTFLLEVKRQNDEYLTNYEDYCYLLMFFFFLAFHVICLSKIFWSIRCCLLFPFFVSLRNKTKLHVNLTHDRNSSSAATQVTLHIEVSFKGELSSLIVTPESTRPDVLQENNIEVMLFWGKSYVIFKMYVVILLGVWSKQCP